MNDKDKTREQLLNELKELRSRLSGLERPSKNHLHGDTIDAEMKRFFTIFENAPIGCAMVNKEGRLLRVNSAFLKMLGYSADELMSMTFMDITHPDDTEEDIRRFNEMIKNKRNFSYIEKRYIWENTYMTSAWSTISQKKSNTRKP
jgi:PAS domain S-box-containing protein